MAEEVICKYCKSDKLDTREVVFKNNTKHIELYCTSCGKHQRYVSQKTWQETEFHFGKHKGQTLEQVLAIEPGYILWGSQNLSGSMKSRCCEALEYLKQRGASGLL